MIRSADGENMILRMHLEFGDSSLKEKSEEQNIETNNSNNAAKKPIQQLQENKKSFGNALQRNDDFVKKLSDQNNAPDVGNDTTQFERLLKKTMRDYFTDRKEKLEKNLPNIVADQFPEDNLTEKQQLQQLCPCNATTSAIKDIADKETEAIADSTDDDSDYDIYTPRSKNLNLTVRSENVVTIGYFKSLHLKLFDSSKKKRTPTTNVVKLAKKMGLNFTHHKITCVTVFQNPLNELYYYCVQFRSKAIKDTFLKKRSILQQFEDTKGLEIVDETNLSRVLINNFETSVSSEETAFDNVFKLAKEMDISLTHNDISFLRVFEENSKFPIYHVEFTAMDIKNKFLETHKREFIVRKANVIIIWNVKSLATSKDVAIAYVIELAQQMDFKITCDEIKFITIFLNPLSGLYYYCVQFKSKCIKDTFLEKQHILKQFDETNNLEIVDETKLDSVVITNLISTDSRYKIVLANVIRLANEINIQLTPKDISFIRVSKCNHYSLDYHVSFNPTELKDNFFKKKKYFFENNK